MSLCCCRQCWGIVQPGSKTTAKKKVALMSFPHQTLFNSVINQLLLHMRQNIIAHKKSHATEICLLTLFYIFKEKKKTEIFGQHTVGLPYICWVMYRENEIPTQIPTCKSVNRK